MTPDQFATHLVARDDMKHISSSLPAGLRDALADVMCHAMDEGWSLEKVAAAIDATAAAYDKASHMLNHLDAAVSAKE